MEEAIDGGRWPIHGRWRSAEDKAFDRDSLYVIKNSRGVIAVIDVPSPIMDI